MRGASQLGQPRAQRLQREERDDALPIRRQLPHARALELDAERVVKRADVRGEIGLAQPTAVGGDGLGDGARDATAVEAGLPFGRERAEGGGELGHREHLAGARRAAIGQKLRDARVVRPARQLLLLHLPAVGRDNVDGHAVLRQRDRRREHVGERHPAEALDRVDPRRRRAWRRDAVHRRGVECGGRLPGGADGIEVERGRTAAAAVEPAHRLGFGVEEEAEGVAADARHAGLGHVERGRHRHARVRRVAASSEHAQADSLASGCDGPRSRACRGRASGGR